MANPFEVFWNTLKSMADMDEKKPMHVGEVMACWTYYAAIKEMSNYEEMALNTTTDQKVKDVLVEAYQMSQSQVERMEKLLIQEGIPLPPTSPKKPNSSPDDIPPGVKATDDELVNGLSVKLAVGIVECASAQAQAIRNDVGMLWAEFQSEMLTFSAKLKPFMQKRGWLKVPPYYHPPGESS